MTLLGFKTILHKKCRSGKNSEGPAENSWVLDLCPAKWKQISKSLQSKTLINNTALEVDDMDSTFIELCEIVKSRPQCQEILQDYSYDDIVKIQITEQAQASASIEVSPNMKIGTCEDLNCKFIQFHISSRVNPQNITLWSL